MLPFESHSRTVELLSTAAELLDIYTLGATIRYPPQVALGRHAWKVPRLFELSFARLSNSGTTIQTDSPSRAAPPIEYIHICKATATADAFLMPCGQSEVAIVSSKPGQAIRERCDAMCQTLVLVYTRALSHV